MEQKGRKIKVSGQKRRHGRMHLNHINSTQTDKKNQFLSIRVFLEFSKLFSSKRGTCKLIDKITATDLRCCLRSVINLSLGERLLLLSIACEQKARKIIPRCYLL